MVALPELESPTVLAVRTARERRQIPHHSTGLGPGSLGEECERRLWYAFRWAHPPETFDGRKLRIFETGNAEEKRVIDDLSMAGLEVIDFDPATGRQATVRLLGGHVRGKTDGEATGVAEAPKTPHLLEVKSHNAKSFRDLKKHGLQVSKPMHYAQMQLYMDALDLTRGLYYAINKDDGDEYAERIKADPVLAAQLLAKAERVIRAERAPPRAWEDETSKLAWKCPMCPAHGLCRRGAFAERNCRTCLHATPRPDGDARWTCGYHEIDLSVEAQRAGCVHHLYLPDLVPGEQVDVDLAAGTVRYVLADGSDWIDACLSGFHP